MKIMKKGEICGGSAMCGPHKIDDNTWRKVSMLDIRHDKVELEQEKWKSQNLTTNYRVQF